MGVSGREKGGEERKKRTGPIAQASTTSSGPVKSTSEWDGIYARESAVREGAGGSGETSYEGSIQSK